MVASAGHPENPAERLISITIQSTWLFWIAGALYLVGPALGWCLAALAVRNLYFAPALPMRMRPDPVPSLVVVWLASMAAMLAILLIGHALNDLGTVQTIKSSIGWAKGWALLALFPLAGAVLKIRPETIYRAVCRLGLQTLLILPIFLAAPYVGLPGELYVSPLRILGGSGPEFFSVTLYTFEPGSGLPRWQFFAPWSPAAGMVGVIYVLCALEEKHRRWRYIGLAAGLAVAVLSQSRVALIALLMLWPAAHLLARMNRPAIWFLSAPAAVFAGLMAPAIIDHLTELIDSFDRARAGSTRVREILGRIAVERWQNEAPWFGHGIVENGPHLVEYMPIGSHHSWYGLLFVKGALGFAALAIPMLFSFVVLLHAAWHHATGRVGLSMILLLFLYSFGENLEIMSYLIWPALVLIGAAARASTDCEARQ
ncbi:O-antigen ligase domain-containing protein [Parasphingopyxis algicola]|uniref:O-antigen ligase domain-containing protein n=1 Tax=Parasphingopyxis algicola TaxID=2026624 RepID=UPI0015A0D500|nr:O-antigen ligase domain-containing protein [Parasphingopyxis algicola]QLC25205.1 O-antigen ligase domain-containing protein [Parasphingopyxis algicola]